MSMTASAAIVRKCTYPHDGLSSALEFVVEGIGHTLEVRDDDVVGVGTPTLLR